MTADRGDGDRLINLILLGLVVFLLGSVAVLAVSITFVQEESGAVPAAELELTRINDSHVRITHSSGERVRTANLSVTVDGVPVDARWSATVLREGEYGIVRVGDGHRLTLLWRHSETDRDVLQQWQLTRTATE